MKQFAFAKSFVLAAAVVAGPVMASASTGAYDDLGIGYTTPADGDAAPADAAIRLAADGQRFDDQGYAIGPDGERINPLLAPRWRIGVFR